MWLQPQVILAYPADFNCKQSLGDEIDAHVGNCIGLLLAHALDTGVAVLRNKATFILNDATG